MMRIVREDETLDEVNGARIIQRKKGYRFSVDSILLADFVDLKGVKKVMDLGAGSGIIAILLAMRAEGLRVMGVELQDSLFDLARRNVKLSSLSDRVDIIKGDLRSLKDISAGGGFDLVVSNPPYHPVGMGRTGLNRERTVARHEVAVTMADIAEVSGSLLREGGRIAVVYPASRLREAVSMIMRCGIGGRRIRKVHTSEAEVVLIEGEKGYEGVLLEENPLYL